MYAVFKVRYQAYSLNLTAKSYKPMGLSGLEPPTSRLSGVRSNQLSYKPILKSFDFSGDEEIRTRYLHLGKVALCQMSYARKMVPPVGIEPTTRGFSVPCSTN